MNTPRPVLKWAGGKNGSVLAILQVLPQKISTYYEPFFGGGAVFFALARERRFERAVISDSNPEVIECLWAIRDDVEGVIRSIKKLAPSRIYIEKYRRIRAKTHANRTLRAARTLFLNHTCFNGLYRVNRSGGFNVPYNGAKKWAPDYENLRAVGKLLNDPNIQVLCCDYRETAKQLELFQGTGPQDAVYLDPPYLPESKTARFAAYTSCGFSYGEHKRLGQLYADLAAQGVFAVASNAAVRGAERIYESIPGTKLYELECSRAINSNGKKRGKVGELLIVNPGIASGESSANVG